MNVLAFSLVYHGGTRIRESIREEFGYGREPAEKQNDLGGKRL